MYQVNNASRKLILLISFLCWVTSTHADTARPFTHDNRYSKLTANIIDDLTTLHYRKLPIDDQFSKNLLTTYLDTLDPAHVVFLQSDIASFQLKYATRLDDQILTGNLAAVQDIYGLYTTRSKALYEATIKSIDKYSHPYKDPNAEVEIDRKQAAWPQTLEQSQDLWDRRVYNEALNLQLLKQDKKKITALLLKRYRHRLERLVKASDEDIYDVFINSVTGQYDPHTDWLSPKAQDSFNSSMSLSLEGIGAVLQMENDKTKITSLVTGGPAAKSGELSPGDIITGVGQGKDGEIEDVLGWRLDEVVLKIRGRKDTFVRLEISDTQHKDSRLVMLKREKIAMEDRAAKMKIINVPADTQGRQLKIGIIDLPSFYMDFAAYQRHDPEYKSTTRDVMRLVRELMEAKVDGIIIDIRNNGGGSLPEVRMMTSLFVDEGPVVLIKTAENKIDSSLAATGKALYDGPLLVITNHMSASASEIFSGAIQDYQRGIIVGEQTFGKGSVQNIDDKIGLGQLNFTTAKYYRVSGESTQHKGVMPDITFPSLFDFSVVGESALENPLPWDTIDGFTHINYNEVSPYLDTLRKNHDARMASSADYKFLQDKVHYYDARKKDKTLSLNAKTRKNRIEADDAALLDITNNFRKQKGLPLFKDYDELDKYEAETASKLYGTAVIDVDNDFVLQESAQIMADYIKLQQKASPVAAGLMH